MERVFTLSTDRRNFIKRLAAAALAAPLALDLARAQMGGGQSMQHGQGMQHAPGAMPGSMATPGGIGPDLLPPAEIPWAAGVCAFCGMTLATPPGAPVGAGFRERTYGQIRLAEGNELQGQGALHYESLGCLFNHAYSLDLADGHGTTYYVASYEGAPESAVDLLLGRSAAFLWGENLRVSMAARLGAFEDHAAAAAYVAAHPELGRVHVHDEVVLMDLAPLPIGNLVPLLVRHLDQ